MTWREASRDVINRVIKEVGTADEKELKRALIEAYPFYNRSGYPYQAWLKEKTAALNRLGLTKEPRYKGLPLFEEQME